MYRTENNIVYKDTCSFIFFPICVILNVRKFDENAYSMTNQKFITHINETTCCD